jgi:hypothetical protein
MATVKTEKSDGDERVDEDDEEADAVKGASWLTSALSTCE